VAFGGVLTTFTVQSATSVEATVPAGAKTGPVSVTNASGTGRSAASFTVLAPPTIAGFSPSSGPVGASVTVTGTAFTGATAVTFNGVSASFTVDSATQVTATVPAGATTGPIGVTTPGGTATSVSSFTVLVATSGLDFYTLTPCRLVDTRLTNGGLGGPALVAGHDRSFTLVGPCGVPPGAKALSVNVTVTAPTAGGHLRLYPAGSPLPTVSSLNYAAGLTRANNAIATLDAAGRLTVYCSQPDGTVHFILDVNGYFR
jgi:hypothetical protein